ncbi:bifunctional folylpolyglutamate synthase/dihydrofolate synthase [Dysgonomonas sp. 216]|uniref:bifunctional folylpolyglutamate synthase/dihydrofolate synthase n=1 Tax=Dysgonomonas sp. 216 TaxID=2302934 RepID=UPI0013D49F75|nr:folylpolyglutamate synthase/dihydrofolate synthase family protein [Dysgonomonas sp. 216]NDW18242.1 bifunctional folylpolyglutamate synthase/dihydrofolate synthase [Dysgonomonas sp. 216]
MNYNETVEYLYNQLPVFQNIGGTAYKEGLDNSLKLDTMLDYPHTKYRTIHIAGTNGKGSTSHLLAAILQQAGYKVGLYTSPHLIDFRERIRIDGKKITEQYVVEFVKNHRKQFEPIYPSFFELTMSMAFRFFADEKVDIAIIETGLGGRLDSTNIITPDLSVITNISFDHIQYLGSSLEKIAEEKAGIIKTGVPVVIGETTPQTKDVFIKKSDETKSPIVFADQKNIILSENRVNGKWIFDTKEYLNLECELAGDAQVKNAATVLASLEILKNKGYNIPANAVYNGFAHVTSLTGLMGRWQIVQQTPKVVCDTAHNVGGIEYIVHQLNEERYHHLHIVLGMANDKDISKVLALLPKHAIYYFTKANISRALNEKELQYQAETFELQGNTFTSVKEAVNTALSNAQPDDFVFIGGSNFIVGEALPLFL